MQKISRIRKQYIFRKVAKKVKSLEIHLGNQHTDTIPTRIPSKNNRNPTYRQVVDFLQKDKTDLMLYTDNWDCKYYAIRVCYNAALAGLRCGIVNIECKNKNGEPVDGHMCNVWKTTDRGFVFTDSTGTDDVDEMLDYFSFDRILDLKINQPLIGYDIFDAGGKPAQGYYIFDDDNQDDNDFYTDDEYIISHIEMML